MNKVKQAMDEQLDHLVVDEALKERVLSHIQPQKRRPFFQFGLVSKAVTLMSVFMVLVVLSINLLIHTDPNFNSSTVPFQVPKGEFRSNTGETYDNYGKITEELPQKEDLEEDGVDQ